MENTNIVQSIFTETSQRDINEITADIMFHKKQVELSFIEIGKLLIEAKEQVPHGEWGAWLQEKVDFSETTARRFIRLAKEYTNQSAVTDLGFSKALSLLALPESERNDFIEDTHIVNGVEKSVIEMTSREVENIVRVIKTLETENADLIVRPIISNSSYADDDEPESDDSAETTLDDSTETTPKESSLMTEFMKKFKRTEGYVEDVLDCLDDILYGDSDTYFDMCFRLSDLSESILTRMPSEFGIRMCAERLSEYLDATIPGKQPEDLMVLIELSDKLVKFIQDAEQHDTEI